MIRQSIQRSVKLPMPTSLLANKLIKTYPELIDTHCHIDFSEFDHDRNKVLAQCAVRHVNTIVIPGIHAKQWPHLLILLNQAAPVQLLGALGMHPFFKAQHHPSHLKLLKQHMDRQSEHIIAVGEIGLDFYHGTEDAEAQITLFTQQLVLAKHFNKPVIIHSRKAHDLICKQLRRIDFRNGGIVHAFSGSQQQAETFISMGFKLGIGGGITYPRASKLRHLVSILPLESFVLETDAPDMPLYGQQGVRNTPEHLPEVLDTLCLLRNESRKTIAQQLLINSHLALHIY